MNHCEAGALVRIPKTDASMPHTKPLSAEEYERMAAELDVMADMIRERPEMNHHFAERLQLLAKQMREDQLRVYPPKP